MDTITILRDLWHHRLPVAVVALLAVLAGMMVAFKISPPSTFQSRRYTVGAATARILVDTPSSQVVEVAPKGSDTLGVRANLLASLMVDGVIKSAVAQRAGLKPNQLVGMTDAATSPSPSGSPPERTAFVLKTQVLTNTAGDQLPIIEIDARAPTVAGAAKLAGAAVDGLRDFLNSKAAVQRIPDVDRLQVDSLGAPQAGLEARGPSKVVAMIAAILVFALGCGVILLALGLVRGLRAAAAREQLEGQEPSHRWEPAEERFFADEEPEPEPAPVAPPRPTLLRSAPEPEPESQPEPAPATGRMSRAQKRAAAEPAPPPPAGSGKSAWDAPLRAVIED